jgi:hypothetical protein
MPTQRTLACAPSAALPYDFTVRFGGTAPIAEEGVP